MAAMFACGRERVNSIHKMCVCVYEFFLDTMRFR